MAQTLKERTAKGLFWGGFSNILQQIIQLIFGTFILRILSPDDVGLVGLLSIFILLATALQESGFSIALINKKEVTQEDYSTVFWTNVGISLILYVILFFSSPFIAVFFKEPVLINLSKIVFLSFVFNAFGIVQNTVLMKKIEMKKLAIVNLGSIMISCSVGLTLALLNFSYWAIAIQAVTLSLTKTIILWITSDWRPSALFNKKSLVTILPFSIKILIANIISQISVGIYSLLLGKFYNKEQVGYYAQANKWYAIPFGIVYGVVNTTAFPVLAEVNTEDERLRLVFRKMLRFAAFISFPLILGFAFISPELIPVLVTDRWLPSVPIIQLLCVWGAFMPIIGMYTNVLTTRGYSGVLLVLTTVYSIALILTLILTVHLGIIYMLIWNLTINFVYLFATLLLTKKKINYRLTDFVKDVFPFLGISVFVFFIVYLCVHKLENMYILLFAKIFLSIVFYVLIMKLSKAIIFKEVIGFIQSKFQLKNNERKQY